MRRRGRNLAHGSEHWFKNTARGLEQKLVELKADRAEEVLDELPARFPESPALEFADRIARSILEPKPVALVVQMSQADVRALIEWVKLPPKLERPHGSALHRCNAWLAEAVDGMKGVSLDGHVLVVEHDWAAAMAGAAELMDPTAEWRLPAPRSIFEFVVNGKRIILRWLDETVEVWNEYDRESAYVPASRAYQDLPLVEFEKDKWCPLQQADKLTDNDPLADLWRCLDHSARPLVNFLEQQVRALCICLEAEVAEKEIVRAPYRLNLQRAKRGRLPLYDYHKVNLARRERGSALPDELRGGDKRRSPRLHFRRGHWAHFANHKTWRKWCLVGDPDLGFIDKEYRL